MREPIIGSELSSEDLSLWSEGYQKALQDTILVLSEYIVTDFTPAMVQFQRDLQDLADAINVELDEEAEND